MILYHFVAPIYLYFLFINNSTRVFLVLLQTNLSDGESTTIVHFERVIKPKEALMEDLMLPRLLHCTCSSHPKEL